MTQALLLHTYQEVDLVEPSGVYWAGPLASGAEVWGSMTSPRPHAAALEVQGAPLNPPSNVHSSAHLLERARTAFEGRAGKDGIPPGHCVVNYFQQGLEAFHPEPQRYDALWLQWAVLYLTDGGAEVMEAAARGWGRRPAAIRDILT